MRPRLRLRVFSLLLAALGFAAPAAVRADPEGDITHTIKRIFEAAPGAVLHLEIDQGEIEVQTRGEGEVFVEIQLTADVNARADAKELFDAYVADFEQRGSEIYVRARRDGGERSGGRWGRWREGAGLGVRVQVRVPRSVHLDVNTGQGNIAIGSVEGNVFARTGHGGLTIAQVGGDADLGAGSGNIEVGRALGDIKANSGAGNITLRRVGGLVEVNVGAGDIYAEMTGQPTRPSRLNTGAGNITVALQSDIRASVVAVTNVGTAQTDFPLRTHGQWMRKHIEGRLNGGGPAVIVNCGIGNVAIRRL